MLIPFLMVDLPGIRGDFAVDSTNQYLNDESFLKTAISFMIFLLLLPNAITFFGKQLPDTIQVFTRVHDITEIIER